MILNCILINFKKQLCKINKLYDSCVFTIFYSSWRIASCIVQFNNIVAGNVGVGIGESVIKNIHLTRSVEQRYYQYI